MKIKLIAILDSSTVFGVTAPILHHGEATVTLHVECYPESVKEAATRSKHALSRGFKVQFLVYTENESCGMWFDSPAVHGHSDDKSTPAMQEVLEGYLRLMVQ